MLDFLLYLKSSHELEIVAFDNTNKNIIEILTRFNQNLLVNFYESHKPNKIWGTTKLFRMINDIPWELNQECCINTLCSEFVLGYRTFNKINKGSSIEDQIDMITDSLNKLTLLHDPPLSHLQIYILETALNKLKSL
jgi:hypothetical protein